MTDKPLTSQQELFAQGVASGLTQIDAYKKAYPKSLHWSPDSVRVAAYKMSVLTHISQRIKELQAKSAEIAVLDGTEIMREIKRLAMSDIAGIIDPQTGKVRLPNELDAATRAAVARPIGKNIISMCEIVESIGPCTAREVHNQAQQMLIVAVRKYLKRAVALDLLRIRRGDAMIFEVASGWRARIDAAPRKMTEPIPRASELLQAERITRRAIKVCPSSVFELHRHL